MAEQIFHRRADERERRLVADSGRLWGKAPRQIAGNGPACVKAYLGPLPVGEAGYSFRTGVPPSHYRSFFGVKGAIWDEGATGVLDVPGLRGHVKIPVEVI